MISPSTVNPLMNLADCGLLVGASHCMRLADSNLILGSSMSEGVRGKVLME